MVNATTAARPHSLPSRRARMGSRSRALISAAALLSCAGGASGQSSFAPERHDVVAFLGVSVVSMTSAAVTANQTVLVRAGTIVAVGDAGAVVVPADAHRIESRGRYLMPGLVDFHTHIAERDDLARYLHHGVTTLVNMGGNGARAIAWRDSTRAGTLVGPDIFVGAFVNGPLGRGGPVTVPELSDVRSYIENAKASRFDFVKVYNSLTAAQFDTAAAVARALDLPLIGHAVRSVGIARSLTAGVRAIAHGEEFLYDVMNDRSAAHIPEAVALMSASGAAVVPNLSTWEIMARQWGRPAVLDSILATPEGRALSAEMVRRWRSADYVRRTGELDGMPVLQQLTHALQRAGVPLLLGTDSPTIPGMFAGASIHADLRLMVAAGLTPYEALVAGTRAAGEFARTEFNAPRFGVVAPGYRADLLLLEANPLADVANASRIVGVLRGPWWTRRAP